MVWFLNRFPVEEMGQVDAERCAELNKKVQAVLDLSTGGFGNRNLASVAGRTQRNDCAWNVKGIAKQLVRISHACWALYVTEGTSVHPVGESTSNQGTLAVHLWDALNLEFGFWSVEQRLLAQSAEDRWEAIALLGLANLFSEVHVELTSKLRSQEFPDSVKARRKAVGEFVHGRSDLQYLSRYLREASSEEPRVAKLLVLGDRLKSACRQLS